MPDETRDQIEARTVDLCGLTATIEDGAGALVLRVGDDEIGIAFEQAGPDRARAVIGAELLAVTARQYADLLRVRHGDTRPFDDLTLAGADLRPDFMIRQDPAEEDPEPAGRPRRPRRRILDQDPAALVDQDHGRP